MKSKSIPRSYTGRSHVLVGMFFLSFISLSAQISGVVTDDTGEALIGANIIEKGTSNGVITDIDGTFSLDVTEGTIITISFAGFESVDVPATNGMSIALSEGVGLEEVVVTGLFDARSRMESSIAISTLDAAKMNRLTPVSGADLFSNTPGVFVNSSSGETRNQVYTRGISAGSNYGLTNDPNGYFYVSLQEDGLPITAISDAVFVADLFFRPDASVKRLESVRGGSSSITSVNAPGGIFNFISNNGLEGNKEVKVKFGLEGNMANPFYRVDFNYGDAMDNGWNYNVGGFYRHADGAYNVGYAQNRGGQVRANFSKITEKGSFRIFGKYLNDINSTTQVIPAVGFDNIELAPGVEFGDSYAFAAGDVNIPDGRGGTRVFRPEVPQQSKDATIGFNWSNKFGNGWSVKNDLKYSAKDYEANSNAATSFTSLFDPATYFFGGVFGPPGSINLPGVLVLSDRQTGQEAVRFNFAPPFMGPPMASPISTNLPAAVDNSVLYSGSRVHSGTLNEIMDQLTLRKKWENASISFGGFYSNSQVTTQELTAGVLSLSPIQDSPIPYDATYEAVTGDVYQLSSPEGYLKLGGSFGYGDLDYSVNQLAFFFGNDFTLAQDRLTIDWGFRLESFSVSGANDRSVINPANFQGGLDSNPLTVYDNFSQLLGQNIINFDTDLTAFSFSAGANYRIDQSNAVYVRIARGQKAPDLRFYAAYTSEFARDNAPPEVQNILQIEAAYKIRNENLKATITPFYSELSDVATLSLTADENNQFYFPTPQFNAQETYGLELEFDYSFSDNFSLAAGATVQESEYSNWKLWNPNEAPREDDLLVDYSGNEVENVPNLLLTLTPTYSTDNFYALLQYRYMGDRWANQPNAYKIPGFGTFTLGAGYDFTDRFSASVNVNNLTNTLGIMSSFAPGGILQVFNPNRVTTRSIAADPNAVHPIITIQPRSLFVTLSYKL